MHPSRLCINQGGGGPSAQGKNLTTVRPHSARREAHENDRLTGGCFWSRRTDTALPPNKAPKNEAQPLFPTLKQKVSPFFNLNTVGFCLFASETLSEKVLRAAGLDEQWLGRLSTDIFIYLVRNIHWHKKSTVYKNNFKNYL